MSGGRVTVIVLAIVAALVAAGVGLDAALPAPAPAVLGIGESRPAEAGTWYCSVGDTAGGNTLTVTEAAPAAEISSDARVDSFADGSAVRGPEQELVPTTHVVKEFTDGLTEVGTAARWAGAPAAVSRSWQVNNPGAPTGYVEGPCEDEPSPIWYVPGVSTAGGAQAWLTIGNPFGADAAVSITFATATGPEDRTRLANIVVPRRSTKTILLNEHVPEYVDLGVTVTTRAGRVIVEGYQSFDAAVGGIDGVTLVKATPITSESWTIPWFRIGADDASWLWVTNPSDRPATLSLSLHTEQGGSLPETLEEFTVPPQQIQRFDLRGVLPEGSPRGGLTVRSDNGVGVIASVATQLNAGDGRTGASIQLGEVAADALWVVSGRTGPGRRNFLHLVNPTPDRAVVDVRIWTELGPVVPLEFTALEIAPGATVALDPGQFLGEATSFTLFVTASEGAIVAGRESFDGAGTYQLVAGPGVPSSTWAGGAPAAPVQFDPSLLERLGTDLAPSPGAPSPSPETVADQP